MIHTHSLNDVALQTSWLTIGIFDGVHRGHQKIIAKLTAGAREDRVPAVVITFDPHPAVVLGRQEVKCLTTPDERADLLAALGVEVVITHPFDASTAQTSAHAFMVHVKQRLGPSHLLMGYDFALGQGREGNSTRLAEIGRELGYSVEVVEAVGDESGVISSTEIRKLVRIGGMRAAAGLLGRPYSLHGPVIHGDGRGRKINIPTANIDYPKDKVIPPNGVYVTWAHLGEEKFVALTNVGVNPTFTPERQKPGVEAYLLDFDRDLYGQDLRLEFVERLRDETKFASVNALLEQIRLDVEQGRALLAIK